MRLRSKFLLIALAAAVGGVRSWLHAPIDALTGPRIVTVAPGRPLPAIARELAVRGEILGGEQRADAADRERAGDVHRGPVQFRHECLPRRELQPRDGAGAPRAAHAEEDAAAP